MSVKDIEAQPRCAYAVTIDTGMEKVSHFPNNRDEALSLFAQALKDHPNVLIEFRQYTYTQQQTEEARTKFGVR